MKIKVYILVFMVLALFAVPQARAADSTSVREYQVKAAFLYNFIMFVDWPNEKIGSNNEPIVIGIIGKDPFENAFDPVKDKQAKDRKVIIKRFKGLEELKKDQATFNQEIETIRKCHLLFICRSEEKVAKEIIDLVKNNNVLTVGDMPKFLEVAGGIINFVLEEQKVRFEINGTAAKEAKLQIRSQLLRLATRVIGEKLPQEAKE